MTRSEQVRFVKGLSDNIANNIIGAIRSGHVPEEFDGHELRVILANQFVASADMTTIKQNPQGSRARVFRNWVKVTPSI